MQAHRFLPLLLCASCAVDEPLAETDQSITGATAIGEPTWAAWLGNCSASILDERWLLTSASCITTPGYNTVTVSVASGSSGMVTVFSGLARTFVHPTPTIAHDVALVYLDDYGISLTGIGKAKLYSDARRPWRDGSEPDDMLWSGFGTSGSDCSNPYHQLRLANGLHLDQAGWNDYYATFWKDGITECPGDHGGQYMVSRGGELVQFAVHSRFDYIVLKSQTSAQYLPRNFGALFAENRDWIESTIAAETSRAFVTSWTTGTLDGYQYRQANVAHDGFDPLQGWQYRCADIATDGTVVMRDCTGATSQDWLFNVSGEVQAYSGFARDRRCLAIDSTAVGAHVHVKTCDGTGFQRLSYTQTGQLRTAMALTRCLSAGAAGQPMTVAACDATSAQQMWSTSPIPPP